MKSFGRKKVWVLNRVVRSDDDGAEMQAPLIFNNEAEACRAKEEWIEDVKYMLEEQNIEYEYEPRGNVYAYGFETYGWEAWVSEERG